MWDRQRLMWEEIIEKLPTQKYTYSVHSEHFEKKNYPITLLKDQHMDEWFGLKKSLMPLPNVCMVYPIVRYVPCSLFDFGDGFYFYCFD